MVGQGEQAHAGGADARSKNGDAVGIAAEVANVFTDPAQSLNLVQQSVIPFRSLVTCAQEPWNNRQETLSEKVKDLGQRSSTLLQRSVFLKSSF